MSVETAGARRVRFGWLLATTGEGGLAGGYVSCMGGIEDMHGGDAGTGHECPAQRPSEGGEESRNLEATEEEQAAITQLLKKRVESAPAGAGAGRASALARAGLKLAAVVLLAAGVELGYADGDEFDDVGCTVAQQPGGTSHGARSAQARERAGGKLPGSGGGSAGGSGGGGPAGRPECEVRAAACAHRMPDGQCQRSNRQCRLFAGAGVVGDMGAGGEAERLKAETLKGEAGAGVAEDLAEERSSRREEALNSAECGVQSAEYRGSAATWDVPTAFAEILRRIGAVAEGLHGLQQENGQLRNAKARLEQIVAEGLLKFLGRVDAQSLRVAYAVLAKGDIAKAARELKMKDSTLRELVGKWKGMGKDYAVLADLVRWRKDTKFTGTVPLNEAVFAAETKTVDYLALIEDVLDGLLTMTEGNWEEKREGLAELLRPVGG